MVRILNNTEKDILIGSIKTFYNLSTCSQSSGNEIIINLSKKLGKVIYSDLRYTTFDKKDFQLYFRKEKLLIGIMLERFREFQESIFRYNTFASFFNPEKGIVVTPTDHLDVFISAKDDYIKTVKNIIENKNGSKVFHFTQKNIK